MGGGWEVGKSMNHAVIVHVYSGCIKVMGAGVLVCVNHSGKTVSVFLSRVGKGQLLTS